MENWEEMTDCGTNLQQQRKLIFYLVLCFSIIGLKFFQQDSTSASLEQTLLNVYGISVSLSIFHGSAFKCVFIKK